MYHRDDAIRSAYDVVSQKSTCHTTRSPYLTERHNVLHADNEHNGWAGVAWICFCREMSSGDQAYDEAELL